MPRRQLEEDWHTLVRAAASSASSKPLNFQSDRHINIPSATETHTSVLWTSPPCTVYPRFPSNPHILHRPLPGICAAVFP